MREILNFRFLVDTVKRICLLLLCNELLDVAQKSVDFYNQLSNFRLRIAEAQPDISEDVLVLSLDRLDFVRNGIPAFERSISEVKLSWRL